MLFLSVTIIRSYRLRNRYAWGVTNKSCGNQRRVVVPDT